MKNDIFHKKSNLDDIRISKGMNILENEFGTYTFENFCQDFNSDESINSLIKFDKIYITICEGMEDLLVYKKNNLKENFDFMFYFNEFDNKINFKKVFNKNVALSWQRIEIPFIINGLEIESMLLNILSKDVIPNVERSRIADFESYYKICYALGRAIHLYVLDNFEMSSNTKILLKKFIDTNYSELNEFNKK